MGRPWIIGVLACVCAIAWAWVLWPQDFRTDGSWRREGTGGWWPSEMRIEGARMLAADSTFALNWNTDAGGSRLLTIDGPQGPASFAVLVETDPDGDQLIFDGGGGAVYRRVQP